MAPRHIAAALLAAAAHVDVSAVIDSTCPQPLESTRDSVLLQTGQSLAHSKEISAHGVQRSYGVTSDCSSRLNMRDKRNAACLIERDSKAMLVYVPYGSPGWDFPGGTAHSGESACETAERETCEETGHQVKALEKLSYNVFRCEVVAWDVCTKHVDEGRLQQKWFGYNEINSIGFRPNTWGDKAGLMRTELPATSQRQPEVDNSNIGDSDVDVCGCKACDHYGFSSTSGQCAKWKTTESNEACGCLQRQGRDRDTCGCKACEGEGWSSTRGSCHHGSHTQPFEACKCLR